jgi:hypothetical protein
VGLPLGRFERAAIVRPEKVGGQGNLPQMGISVSVDSWVEQTLDDLNKKPYPLKNPIYERLVQSASVSSEIFVLDPSYISRLFKAPGSNFANVLSVLLDSLLSSDAAAMNNAAAFLARIYPYFCNSAGPESIHDALLNERPIGGSPKCAGREILSISLRLFVSFTSSQSVLDMVDVNFAIFDLLALTIFSLLVYDSNQTLLHLLLVQAEELLPDIATAFFQYVGQGGRRESIITILTVLLFHPSESIVPVQKDYIARGGRLAMQLARLANDNTDLACLLCSLGIRGEDAQPSLASQDPAILRVALTRILMNSAITGLAPADVAKAFQITKSPLARVVMGLLGGKDPQAEAKCPPIKDFVFTKPHDSDFVRSWVVETVAKTYLYTKSFLFTGTGIQTGLPELTHLDNLVSESV